MIAATELLETVIKLAEENPNKQARCVYFNADFGTEGYGQPCCIVGHGLAKLGINVEEFLEDDDLNGMTNVRDLISEQKVVEDDREAVLKLYAIQARQDIGDTWGQALNFSKTMRVAESYDNVSFDRWVKA